MEKRKEREIQRNIAVRLTGRSKKKGSEASSTCQATRLFAHALQSGKQNNSVIEHAATLSLKAQSKPLSSYRLLLRFLDSGGVEKLGCRLR